MSEKKSTIIYTKEFVSKEVNWLKKDIDEMIKDWDYAMLDIGKDAPVPVPVKSRLEKDPFPFFVVNNLIPKSNLKKLNKILPKFSEIGNNDVLYQSTSKTKKTILLFVIWKL